MAQNLLNQAKSINLSLEKSHSMLNSSLNTLKISTNTIENHGESIKHTKELHKNELNKILNNTKNKLLLLKKAQEYENFILKLSIILFTCTIFYIIFQRFGIIKLITILYKLFINKYYIDTNNNYNDEINHNLTQDIILNEQNKINNQYDINNDYNFLNEEL